MGNHLVHKRGVTFLCSVFFRHSFALHMLCPNATDTHTPSSRIVWVHHKCLNRFSFFHSVFFFCSPVHPHRALVIAFLMAALILYSHVMQHFPQHHVRYGIWLLFFSRSSSSRTGSGHFKSDPNIWAKCDDYIPLTQTHNVSIPLTSRAHLSHFSAVFFCSFSVAFSLPFRRFSACVCVCVCFNRMWLYFEIFRSCIKSLLKRFESRKFRIIFRKSFRFLFVCFFPTTYIYTEMGNKNTTQTLWCFTVKVYQKLLL